MFTLKKWNALRPKLKHLSVAVKKIERQFLRSNEMKRFVETTPRTIRYDDVPCLAMVILKIWSR